jgi:hypothetical protein
MIDILSNKEDTMNNQANMQAMIQNAINGGGNVTAALSSILNIIDAQINISQQAYYQSASSVADVGMFSQRHQLRLTIHSLHIFKSLIEQLQANLLVGQEETEISRTLS